MGYWPAPLVPDLLPLKPNAAMTAQPPHAPCSNGLLRVIDYGRPCLAYVSKKKKGGTARK
jgi:hypothetical protein